MDEAQLRHSSRIAKDAEFMPPEVVRVADDENEAKMMEMPTQAEDEPLKGLLAASAVHGRSGHKVGPPNEVSVTTLRTYSFIP
eukprot:11209889-Lingulodinium_polyedra.AAC.1